MNSSRPAGPVEKAGRRIDRWLIRRMAGWIRRRQNRAIASTGALRRFPMNRLLPSPVRGVLALTLLAANTLLWCALLLPISTVKFMLPFHRVRRRVDPILNELASRWVDCNGAILWRRRASRLDVLGNANLRPDDWYMVTSNHQSWVDIFVLQRVLNGRIPLLKFFLKQELAYVPVIGLAWWALDFPFMRRHGKAALRKHPELRLKDRDATRRACAKFALTPTSVMTFPEGTRFTTAKHASQSGAYRHLLKPKAGSLAMSLNAMGDQFRSLLDVTIVYPDGVPTFWQFLCGGDERVVVRVSQLPIAAELHRGDYTADPAYRRAFHRWLDTLWHAKDDQIDALLQSAPGALALREPRCDAASGTAVQ
jgi:1-acyl-sn-glycerol-3-phosphate acyltransferase